MSGSGATVTDLVQIVDTFGSGAAFRALIGLGSAAVRAESYFALAAHSHAIADVTGLQAALDGKQAAGSYAAASHTHATSEVTGLDAALAAKANDSAVVHNTGAETVAGDKTFTGAIVAPSVTVNNSNSSNVGIATQPWLQVKSNSGTLVAYVGAGVSIFTSVAIASTDGGVRTVGRFAVSTGNSTTPTLVIDTSGGTSFTGSVAAGGALFIGPKTFATLPSASANPGACFRLTDRGQKIVFSDSTNWLFVHDNSIAS